MLNKIKPYIYITPVTMLLAFVMGVGIFTCVGQSLGYFPQIGLNELTFKYYEEIFRDKNFIKSFLFTLKIALISSLISVLIGVLVSYFLSKSKQTKLRKGIFKLPIIVPHIVAVVIVIIIFSQSGIISRILYNLGIINDSSQFMQLVLDQHGLGIIMTYIWKGIPYVIITVYGILKSKSEEMELVAKNLGASEIQVFKRIVLPTAMPSIISSFLILFSFSFGSFEVPFLIGPSSLQTLPVYAYLIYSSSDLYQRPLSMGINVMISLSSVILLILYNKVFNKLYKFKL
ncbi:ABC transporter permease [Romboutsia lituseburensis]|uniref:ABC transporter permease n=1 Tax=Romboutsia lituseburensis TaxID=1537 RepID=UPI00215A441E|nr:ABC transporter permease subunit [Romboutsia lituseburensis]MCR8746334.1 ABC transporter permease subunit [Romboutsia lituseburensis]